MLDSDLNSSGNHISILLMSLFHSPTQITVRNYSLKFILYFPSISHSISLNYTPNVLLIAFLFLVVCTHFLCFIWLQCPISHWLICTASIFLHMSTAQCFPFIVFLWLSSHRRKQACSRHRAVTPPQKTAGQKALTSLSESKEIVHLASADNLHIVSLVMLLSMLARGVRDTAISLSANKAGDVIWS